ncbi:hypothetical protein PICMEDRAFT_71116 [Pichia membranifaciens NRRL Y-2026]|uniref:Elongator complex protein 1 n=1 Tax=Pichia membranifaciens NRRL Y-2026 TaxID=763406 RepID=A0A1E3NVK0_9ASCO|nr:hypothetical protein PICMEDRAFT_71116 [Pichia membranifaciens NRRL Y-2026]ODQ49573.1 hypothetical protein PICMEDRAFT_71116 [Pichia membranifaciens NRRL Y-2026]
MKNLKVLNKSRIVADSQTCPDLPILDSCFDLISDSLTLALGSEEFAVIEIQQFQKNGAVRVLASVPFREGDTLLSLSHFEDSNQLVLIFSKGDIITATYDPSSLDIDQTFVEIIGSIDCGIKSAKWSHDEEILSIVTNEHNLLLFSRFLDLVLEKKIDPSDLQLNNQVSLGWGKEETQFKGRGIKQIERERKILKNAGLNIDSENAILCDPTIKEIQAGNLSKFDSQSYEISWRGDCQFFAISCIETLPEKDQTRRVIRVYSREGDLISCSEPIDGQEHSLSWKPQGSLIASTQRRFEPEINDLVLDVIFFEKNGLRHGEFDSRLNASLDNIYQIDWSSNSEYLLLQLESSVQLWYVKNYHWYLKQEISAYNNEKILFTKFHPEKPSKLMIGTSASIEIVDMSYTTTKGCTSPPHDAGVNLVIDGMTCMLTPFAKASVPPPIAYRDIDVDERSINSVSISHNNKLISILTSSFLYLFHGDENWDFKLTDRFRITDISQNSIYPRQVTIAGNDKVYVLFDEVLMNLSSIAEFEAGGDSLTLKRVTPVPSTKVITLSTDLEFESLVFETIDGSIFSLDANSEILSLGQFPQICTDFIVADLTKTEDGSENDTFLSTIKVPIGLMSSGKLYVNSKLISQGVTSMLVTGSYLLYTTAQHQLKFIHLLQNETLYNDEEFKDTVASETDVNFGLHDERIRNIERGSVLVNAIPSKSCVILQAPRGNLESIYPRIMVLSDVRKAIKAADYKTAFLTCRVHRIALDILHDYDPELFFKNVEKFINQLGKVEYLDLFLSCLLEQDVCETKYKESTGSNTTTAQEITDNLSKINLNRTEKGLEKTRKICDAILEVLLNNKKYKQQYLQSIITAYAAQKPPRTQEALELISTFDNDQEIEKSVQHLCFLLDVNKLYNIALGIYNIPLALVVAQQSQKDPKEYLPFLQGLYEETELRRRFMVDSYLKKFDKALNSLIQIPISEKHDIKEEIIEFIIEHELYKHALSLYKHDEENFNVILRHYASFLQATQKYTQAAIIYEKLSKFEEALDNYIWGKKWREAISIALKPEYKESKLIATCNSLIESLTLTHEYKAAAYISFKYLNNIKEALEYYGKEYEYSTAIQLCLEEGKPELIEEVVDPSIREGFGSIAELLADCKGQIESQLKRLRDLREKKNLDPYAFYGEIRGNENTPDNVSIAPSETSTKESFFTRYTGKTSGTAKTGASRRTAKNKRREDRKRARGKKGTIYEEEYLISSIGRLIDRLEITKPDSIKLLEAMVKRNMVSQAYLIQSNFVDILQLLKDTVVEIYTVDKRDRERLDDNGMIYYVDEIPVPVIKDFPALDVLDF